MATCYVVLSEGKFSVESLRTAPKIFSFEPTSVLALTIASELAATRPDVHGSGSFLPALIDELYNLTADKILERAKVEVI